MRVSKEQIITGILSYVENEVIPQIEDKPTQIILSIAAKSIQSNKALVDSVFENPLLKTLLVLDESGTYEIDGLFGAIMDSVKQYGEFPLVIPPIPIVSPIEKTLTFKENDVAEIKRRIERSAYNNG